ncbi:hypothetical protein P3X46_010343 [Hevea brasiliensis]|uniref:Bifunctional inhibitor/plant lipid transfer protein/seed storage helical domain-containing protein n=1 Tax=Hevea brasiliensis TaxID=3981 RepID=A0ABQ9MHU2_HEVBR|nr:non-specific lipid transfer protein GPI-anchored 23 [Hevea brasiliensis]KAJ9178464.1 hypothetical protein P3X46_010343 [Hevea brasiliensis]
MLRLGTAIVASTFVALIFSSTLCKVSAQAPSPVPFPGFKPPPSAPTPLTPLAPTPLGPSAPTLDCMKPLLNMSDCLSYVQESSNTTVPDKNCCPELAGLIEGSPICLCQLLSNTSLAESYGIKIDINRALKLPSVCRISTPPVSTCAALGYPVPGPISGPAPSEVNIAPGPSSANDCMTPLLNMSDCLSYVAESSNATVPDKNCCPELAGLIEGSPVCLCQLLSNTSLTESYGIKIDISRALKLPSVCRISTPPVSTCADLGYPVPGPISGPSPSISPGDKTPSGLDSSPSAGENGSGASNIAGSAQAFIIGLAFSFLPTIF